MKVIKIYYFCRVLNNIGFPMKGKLVKSNFDRCVCDSGSTIMQQNQAATKL
jgi:hypothetical protein